MLIPNRNRLDYTAHFKESLQVVDLTDSHCQEDQSLEKGPEDNAGIRVLVDAAVNTLTNLHVILFMLHTSHCSVQLINHSF